MTDHRPDIHCAGCRRYLYSIGPRDLIPSPILCTECIAKGWHIEEKAVPPNLTGAEIANASTAAVETQIAKQSFERGVEVGEKLNEERLAAAEKVIAAAGHACHGTMTLAELQRVVAAYRSPTGTK